MIKDFNNDVDNDNLFEILTSSKEISKDIVKKPQVIKNNNTNKTGKKQVNKSVLKSRKFDFMLDPELVDYLDHQIFLTGIRDKKDYLNHLIKQDMIKRLNISEGQDLIDEWLKYKDTHIPKGLK